MGKAFMPSDAVKEADKAEVHVDKDDGQVYTKVD